MNYVIQCGYLFDATGAGCLKKDRAIAIEGNRITKVGPMAEACIPDAQIIDLTDKFVMPGLIDAHVHLQFNADPNGRSGSFFMSVGELALKSYATAVLDLMAGFTTVRNMGAAEFTDVAVRNSIDSGLVKGPRVFCSGMPIGATGGHGDSHFRREIAGGALGHLVSGPDRAREMARYSLKYGADQLKVAATGGVLSHGDEPGAPELFYDEIKAVVEVAASRGRITAAHAVGKSGIINAVKAGITSIEHGTMMDEECIDLMVMHGTYLVPTLIASYLMAQHKRRDEIPANSLAKAQKFSHTHVGFLKLAKEKGVKIGFGTDAATPFNYHGKQALEFKLLVEAGLTAEETLLAATKTNSELMKWNDRIGSIEAGKFADIVAFDESPLENIEIMQQCAFIMKDGEIFKQ